MRRFINSIIVVGILVGLILPGYSTRAELTTTTAALSHRQESKELYSHGSPIVEELELQHEAGSEGEYETATSPRTISRRLSHRMNADRVLHMRSRTSTKKTMMKAKKPAAAAKKPPAATKKASSTKSKSAASSSASTAASPSSLTGTKSKDEVFSHFIVAFRKGYKDLATAKAKQATVKANTAKIDALNKRIKNNEPPVAQLVKSDVATATAATAAAGSSSSSSSTKKTNTKAKAKATTTRGKARFADVEMDAPKKTTAASKSSKSSTKSAKSSKSSSSSSSSSRKKKAVEATPAERSIAKTKLKPVSRRTAKQQQQRKLGRAVFGVNRFTDLTPAQFKAKYANSQPASRIVLAVKTKGEKKMNKMKSKKIPRRGVKSSSSSSSSSSSKKQKSTTTASAKTKKRSLIELAVNGPPPAKPPAPKTSSANTGGVTAASFANSNVAGGPSKPTTKTSSSSTSGVSASSFGNSNVGGGPAKTTTKTSSSNTGGTTSASFGNSNVGGGPSKPTTKTSSSSTSGTSSSSFGNSNVGGGPNDQGSAAAAAAPADDPVASAVAISPAGTWSDDEIADFQAQARLTPNVPYRKFNDFVDQPCDWSGVIPVVRATSGCGACWAVTTADAIQAAYFRTYGKGLKQVSSQGIMDCNFNAYNGGCKGGSLANAINSIIDNSVARKVNGGEVYFESDYPYRYNTDADAMHQQCKPKSGSPQSLVSTWAWAIPPAKMAVVDMTGYTRALQELEIAKQKGAVAEAGSAKVEKQKLELQAQSAAADKALANREEQIAALTKATEDEVEAGSKKLNDMNAECRRLDSVRSSVLPPQLDAKMKQAIDQRDAARTAFYAYEKTDPYQGANRKDPVKYQQMRDLWTQAEDNVKAVSKSNDDALRAASDAASKCRSDVSTYQTNWNQQRTQMIADLHAKIQSLPSSQSVVESYTQPISNEIKATVDANMKQYNSFVTMTAAELMDSFSGYASLSYGWYTNPEYVEVMSMQVSAEEKREILLARALNKYGPLAVIINAAELNSYAGGILQATDMMCSSAPEKGDHAIMLVGLAKDPATNRQYWILKNSWGTDWGNNGYLYLARGQNTCGLANAPARVAIKGDANDPVAVQQDAQIAAFLAGQPSSYTARE